MRINNFTKLLILVPTFSVYAQTEFAIDFGIKTEPIENGYINQTNIGVQFDKNIGSQNKLTNTFTYKNTKVTNEMDSYLKPNYVTNYSDTQFNGFSDTFEFSHKLSGKTKLTLTVEPTANYQGNFEISDITVLGGIELNQTLNKNSSIDVGIKRMTVFGKPEILPTFAYNRQFGNNIYLKLGFPNSELAYSNSFRSKFSLNNVFSGSSYNLNSPIASDDINAITQLGFSQMETTLQFERKMDTSWYVSFKGGYSSNKEFKFSDEDRTKETNLTLRNGGVFSVSIKYKL